MTTPTKPDATFSAPAQQAITDERIKAAFQKYGTGRPEGFAAAVHALLQSAPSRRSEGQQEGETTVEAPNGTGVADCVTPSPTTER
jgi:hypothetical protein